MADERTNIRAALLTRVNDNVPGIPISWPGVPALVAGANLGLEVDVIFDAERPRALGTALNRIDGHLQAIAWARAGGNGQPGTDELEGLVDDVRALFSRNQTVTAAGQPVIFKTPQPVQATADDGFLARGLRCPFYYFTA